MTAGATLAEVDERPRMYQSGWMPEPRPWMMDCIIWGREAADLQQALSIIYSDYPPEGYGTALIDQGRLWEVSPELAGQKPQRENWQAARIRRNKSCD